MVEALDEKFQKFLVWLIGILLTFNTGISLWAGVTSIKMEEKFQTYKEVHAREVQSYRDYVSSNYVRNVRYKADCERDSKDMDKLEKTMKEIDRKMDRLLLRQNYGMPDTWKDN